MGQSKNTSFKLNESMVYQKGKPNNPFLVILQQPGAAEVITRRPAMDGTGRNLGMLLELLKKSESLGGLEAFLNKDDIPILNASPFPSYKNYREEFTKKFADWRSQWIKIATSIIDCNVVKYILCFGKEAVNFCNDIQIERKEHKIVISSCHIGTKGLNRTIKIGSLRNQCPQFQRLSIVAKYLCEKICAGTSCDFNEFKDWLCKNTAVIIRGFSDELKAYEDSITQNNFGEYLSAHEIVLNTITKALR